MRKLNLHYISVFIVLLAVCIFNWQYSNEAFVFLGFAENKETEIRLDHPATIKEIYVTPGKKVSKGTLLLKVTHSQLQLEQSDLIHDLARLESEFQIWEANLKASIHQLEAQKVSIKSNIQIQLDQLESELAINKSLIKDLKSIQPATDRKGRSPNEIKITGLKKELKLQVRPIESEIRKLKKELRTKDNPLKIKIEQLQNQLGFKDQEEEELNILAPSDGVVGSLFCKVGEQIPSFSNLLTFYQEKPTMVKAYVLESLMLYVKIDDTLEINSTVLSSSSCTGKVIGLGSRIVEIPERLRKNPTFKTYGREVLVEIPSDNNFLQGEKVILRLNTKDNEANKVIRVFTTPKTSTALKTNATYTQ